MKAETMDSVFANPKWEVKPKLHRYPTKRWGHTSVLNKNKLYIYGGKTGKAKEPLYQLDCDTLECHILESHGLPDSRESHSCSLVKDRLIVWGGCRQQKALNDCINFMVKDRVTYWNKIAQFPILKQRESHATVVLKDKYILLYGGSNEQEIYDDIWVFNTELQIWFEIKNVTGKMKKRLGCTITVVGDTIYMFGGEGEDQNYQNDLYTLNFESMQFNSPQKISTLVCELIVPKSHKPPPRSCHSAITYSDRYLIIIGGEGLGFQKGKPTSILMNDVWYFDTVQNYWQEINVTNRSAFKPRSCFTANIYQNKIYVFGGLISTDNFRSSDQLIVLSLTENVQKKMGFCNICKLHYQPIQLERKGTEATQIAVQRDFRFGLKNLYRLAKTIKNPFDAICLLIESFHRMRYEKLNLDLIEGKILMIQGLGTKINEEGFSQILNNYEFADEIRSDDPRVLQALDEQKKKIDMTIFSSNLKNACARLGQTFIFINRRNSLIDIMLVDSENVFYSEVDAEDYSVGKKQKHSFQIITFYMRRNNLNLALIQNQTFTIAVTELKAIAVEQSEIKVQPNSSVEIAGINKKINLAGYLSNFFLKSPTMQVFVNERKVEFKSLYHAMKGYQFQSGLSHDLISVFLKESDRESSIFFYKNGVKVGKYLKKDQPYVEGYIQLPFHYELAPLRHKIDNSRIVENITALLVKQFVEALYKRKPVVNVRELEEEASKM